MCSSDLVALAQRHDLFVGAALPGLPMWTWMRGREELRQLSATEGVAQHAKGPRRIAEAVGSFGGSRSLYEEGSQGLILALPWGCGLLEETASFC